MLHCPYLQEYIWDNVFPSFYMWLVLVPHSPRIYRSQSYKRHANGLICGNTICQNMSETQNNGPLSLMRCYLTDSEVGLVLLRAKSLSLVWIHRMALQWWGPLDTTPPTPPLCEYCWRDASTHKYTYTPIHTRRQEVSAVPFKGFITHQLHFWARDRESWETASLCLNVCNCVHGYV